MKYVLLTFIILLSGCAVTKQPDVQTSEKKVSRHAQMQLLKNTGATVNTKDFLGNGKWTLIMIWDKHCGLVNFTELSKFHKKYRKKNIEVLGVSVDGKAKLVDVNLFLKPLKVSFPNLVGDLDQVDLHYRNLVDQPLKGTPTYLLFNQSGELSAHQVGTIDLESVVSYVSKPDS